MGEDYTEDSFQELCFAFGIELDEVVEEERYGEMTTVYKIEIAANRHDLLSLEGLTRSLRIFLERMEAPVYHVDAPAEPLVMTVAPETSQIRPYVVCAVLRGVQFDPARYASFIDLQEKLHQNICRRRRYVAIGTHDLATLSPPFRYEARAPGDISFVPLTEESGRSFTADRLLAHYREDASCKHLKPYTDLIADSPVYPVIYDSAGTVLSLPPIINGRHSRIRLETRDVFIECTATDYAKANTVLDIVVATFSEYCAVPFRAEAVRVVYEEGAAGGARVDATPKLTYRTHAAALSEVRGIVGVDLAAEEVCRLCTKMQLGPARISEDGGSVEVTVPPTRGDVLHAVDVVEDVAIAYGFNRVPERVPSTLTVGKPLPLNHFCDLLRDEVGRAGYVEVLTHGLCSREDNFTRLRRPEAPAVSLLNPANEEYQVVRTTLLPGALKTLNFNKSMSFQGGVKVFEVSDVVLPADNEVGAVNRRRIVAVYAGRTSGFEVIHGLVDRIMTLAQVPPAAAYALSSLTPRQHEALVRVARPGAGEYTIREGHDPAFFPGRCAEVVVTGGKCGPQVVLGVFGALHPDVLTRAGFDIGQAASALELDLEPLL